MEISVTATSLKRRGIFPGDTCTARHYSPRSIASGRKVSDGPKASSVIGGINLGLKKLTEEIKILSEEIKKLTEEFKKPSEEIEKLTEESRKAV